MILSSDISLISPLWERADNELVNSGVALFNRLVDIYILACAIGVREDQTITEFESPLDNPKTIGRNTYQSLANTDLKDLLDYLLQNALINSKTINLSNEDRLKLAFDPDFNIKNFSSASFLTGFANFGIQEIFNHIDSGAPIVAVDEITSYLKSLEESDYDFILNSITLEDMQIMSSDE